MNSQNPKSIYNIPNALSVFRIIAAPILLALVVLDEQNPFKWLLLASLISDILDGLIARLLKQESQLGARLDSIGDMSTFLVTIFGLFKFQEAFLSVYKIQIFIVLAFYFLETGLSLLRFRTFSSFHTYLARITAYLQGIFIMSLFLFGFKAWLFYPTVVVSLLAYTEEMIILFVLNEMQSNLKGLYWVLKNKGQQ